VKQVFGNRELATVAVRVDGRRAPVLPTPVVGISIVDRLVGLGLELIGLIRGFRRGAWR
jgi:hypothetical protein